jgi:hypothetical protein
MDMKSKVFTNMKGVISLSCYKKADPEEVDDMLFFDISAEIEEKEEKADLRKKEQVPILRALELTNY